MNFLRSNLIILIFFLFNSNFAFSTEKLAFIDLDIVLKQTNYGKSLLIEIENINNKNIQTLKNKEKELKKKENDINKKKNIISDDEYTKELNILKENIIEFREQKNKMVKSFKTKRSEHLNNFFIKISPIIQNYMNKNSIDILLEKKNVFIGKSNSDITDIIIEEINKKFN